MSIIYYCHRPALWYELAVNRAWMPLWLLALGGAAVTLFPVSASAQSSCRIQAVFVRPDFVRPGFDRPNVLRSSIDRPSLERPSLDRPDVVRASFDRPVFIRPVFDDPCVKLGGSSSSSARSSYASILDLATEKDSKLARASSAKIELPRQGVVLASRAKPGDAAAVGACCGQQPVNREEQHRLYR